MAFFRGEHFGFGDDQGATGADLFGCGGLSRACHRAALLS